MAPNLPRQFIQRRRAVRRRPPHSPRPLWPVGTALVCVALWPPFSTWLACAPSPAVRPPRQPLLSSATGGSSSSAPFLNVGVLQGSGWGPPSFPSLYPSPSNLTPLHGLKHHPDVGSQVSPPAPDGCSFCYRCHKHFQTHIPVPAALSSFLPISLNSTNTLQVSWPYFLPPPPPLIQTISKRCLLATRYRHLARICLSAATATTLVTAISLLHSCSSTTQPHKQSTQLLKNKNKRTPLPCLNFPSLFKTHTPFTWTQAGHALAAGSTQLPPPHSLAHPPLLSSLVGKLARRASPQHPRRPPAALHATPQRRPESLCTFMFMLPCVLSPLPAS